MLVGIFVLAIVIHLLHGMFNVAYLAIYTAAAWAVAAGQRPATRDGSAT